MVFNTSMTRTNRRGERGCPCLSPCWYQTYPFIELLIKMEAFEVLRILWSNPIITKAMSMEEFQKEVPIHRVEGFGKVHFDYIPSSWLHIRYIIVYYICYIFTNNNSSICFYCFFFNFVFNCFHTYIYRYIDMILSIFKSVFIFLTIKWINAFILFIS